ncbi:MAG: hypothetical protein GF344_20275, partial [Chitinivibrionales bacterium]|nr:hypothetical protein [Chitinivibrionales bacterium]MBD3358944.1 hypothetical protein [Chitinivibrionales bacterium]
CNDMETPGQNMANNPRKTPVSERRPMRTRRVVRRIVYAVLLGAIAWQAVGVSKKLKTPSFAPERSVTVQVKGDVSNPGMYRVPEGTTRFEILKAAGVRTTSDLSAFNLAGQVDNSENLEVGSLEKPVGIKASVRLEFYFGNLTIIAPDGMQRPVQEGLTINEGDRILTEENSQAELSLNQFSRVDMDGYTELIFDRIGADGQGRGVIDAFQKSGTCWYRIAYAEKAELFRVLTPLVNMSIGGQGADFTVEAQYSQVTINCTEGLLLVQRPDGTEEINLIAGQSVTVHGDGRPFEVTRFSSEASVTERFSQLNRARTEAVMRHMPFSFLFCGTPSVYYFVSVQFDRNIVHAVRLPPNLSVSDQVQGFTTLQEAFLYGGPAFSTTLVERVMNTRVPKYAVFEKSDVVRAVAALGGVTVGVDNAAAGALNIPTGLYTFRGQEIVDFLKPSISGTAAAAQRQVAVMRALFDGLRSRSIVVNALMTEQILSGLQSNIQVTEAMRHYKNFTSRNNWTFRSHHLPGNSIRSGAKTVFEADRTESRKLLTSE